MQIKELARQTGVSAKTIRYYELIGLMPPPQRSANNYRQYALLDVERLRFIASARALGIPIKDTIEIVATREQGIAPCKRLLGALDQQLTEIDQRIADMLALRETLKQIKQKGAVLPQDDVAGENCVCYLVKTYRQSGQVVIRQETA